MYFTKFQRWSMMFVDSHCHLSSPEVYNNLENVIKKANDLGVKAFLNAGAKFDELQTQLDICARFDNIWTATGVHPHDATDYEHITVEDVLKNAIYDKVVAIGECGLDYFYDFAPKDVQIKVFAEMIKAAQESALPIVIHTREADTDTITLLREAYQQKPFKGVIHCYSSSFELASAALEIGFYISASGMITFKNADVLRANFKKIPLDRLLIETDTPYLAPVPFRGKVNEPSYVIQTAKVLADIKGLDLNQISAITTKNFFNLFDKAKAEK